MSLEKPAGNEGKKVFKALAPAVLAFFTGQQIEKQWGITQSRHRHVRENSRNWRL